MSTRKKPDSRLIREAIDGDRIPRVWLWTGPEEFLKEELFDRLAARVVAPGLESLNLDRFRAGDDSLERILTTIATLPMMSDRRAILLRNVEALGRKEREFLAGAVSAAGPEVALVLATERGPRDSLNLRLAKAGAEARVFWTPFPEQTITWIGLRFRDLGKQCSPGVAEALLRTCGGGFEGQVPLRQVAPEIEKVALSVKVREEIQESDLTVIGRRAGEELLYKVSERMGERDLSGAMRALDGALLFRSNDPVRITSNLSLLFHQVASVQDLRAAGISSGEVQKKLRIWPKQWETLQQASRCYSRGDVTRSVVRLARADRTLKSRADNPRLVLETTIASICRKSASGS
jgi:DNA polymerase-3 subunit delta